MLVVYGHYKYFNSFSAGTVFIRQNLYMYSEILTSKVGPRTERVSVVPMLFLCWVSDAHGELTSSKSATLILLFFYRFFVTLYNLILYTLGSFVLPPRPTTSSG